MRAYLGLGSNVGDRLSNLREAVARLDSSDGVRVLRRSSVYETEPVGEVKDQRDFYNAVVDVETDLDPVDLLDLCKRIERQMGREEGGSRHGPRPIDVDVLIAGDVVVSDDRLVLPHPEIAHRRFVLAPLLELDPALSLPENGSLAEALARIGTRQRIERIGALD